MPDGEVMREVEAALAPEPGWLPFPVKELGRERSSFISNAPDGLQTRFYRDADGHLVGKVRFGPDSEGPPQHAHGGSITTVLDEAMGKAAWLIGHRSVSGRLTVNFRRKVPLGTVARFAAWVEEERGRKLLLRSHLLAADGSVFADANALFVSVGRR